MNYSTTQAANISALVGLLLLVLPKFHIIVTESQLTDAIGAIWTLTAIGIGFVNRYQKGDVTAVGFKK